MGGRFEIESWRGLTAARAGLVRVLETLWGGAFASCEPVSLRRPRLAVRH